MMARLGELWRRLWYLLNRARYQRELRDEMDAHRAMKGDEGPRFGNTLRLREEAADAWGWTWLEHLLQDARFGARLLRRSRAFSVTAIAVLSVTSIVSRCGSSAKRRTAPSTVGTTSG